MIGCAGWTIPREAATSFEGEGSHLQRYAARLPAVEINSCFHRPHRVQTYVRWAATVPDDFKFSVKLPRTITHDARLAGCEELLRQFASEAGALGDKLGCVLMQLPPSMQFDATLAADFFVLLKQSFGCMIACEARHATWFSDEATQLLRENNITRVIADPAKGQPGPHVATTSAMYVRLHGSPRVYYSSYEQHYIADLADEMSAHLAAGRTVWCIFDNTASGAAAPNAVQLQHFLAQLDQQATLACTATQG
ncbi:MAG: hypothetical protein JWQ01_166 [Massilia sp.]|nr:hypothetical protein [Massilia sp.]